LNKDKVEKPELTWKLKITYRDRTVLIIFNNFLPVERGALIDMSAEVATKTVCSIHVICFRRRVFILCALDSIFSYHIGT
jgi:hypothetical protein